MRRSCATVLKHCLQGTAAGREKVLNNDFSGARVGLMQDLHMLLVSAPGARERTEAEYSSLLQGMGFRDVQVTRLDAPRDLVVARKAR